MTRLRSPAFATRNHLLASLPEEELKRLWPQAELVEFPLRQVVVATGQHVASVHFPETGWVSMLATLENGDAAEVGLIGREGMIGLSALFGAEESNVEGVWQSPGTAWRLPAIAFREAFERSSDTVTFIKGFLTGSQARSASVC